MRRDTERKLIPFTHSRLFIYHNISIYREIIITLYVIFRYIFLLNDICLDSYLVPVSCTL